jgi:hypothetical protein
MLSLRHFVTALAGLTLIIGVVGCATSNQNIPANAQMVSAGNETIAFTAPRRGMVYVLDKNTNKLLYSGNVDKGQTVSIDPTRRDRNITLDGNAVTQASLNVGHTYQIFFRPDENVVERHVTEERVYHDHDRL